MTFEELAALEPGLSALLAEAKKPSRIRTWYGRHGLKADMTRLVGFMARGTDPRLHITEAYDIAYKVLYQAFEGRLVGLSR